MNNNDIKTTLSEMLNIRYPIIIAPMFLVSNTKMIISGIKAGATGAIPAMNYRTTDELRKAIREVKEKAAGPFGINLIVNKSNFTRSEERRVGKECRYRW